MEMLTGYIPIDRRQAMARGHVLPDRAEGAALFADISGFTALTEAFANQLGPERGAEELTHHLNQLFSALIAEIHHFGGSVVAFSGDAVTCWFAPLAHPDSLREATLRATACGLSLQHVMNTFASVATPSVVEVHLALKVAVAPGSVRRFLVGDPQMQLFDVLAGKTLESLAKAEQLSERGEVVLTVERERAPEGIQIARWREDAAAGLHVAVVENLTETVAPNPWSELPPGSLSDEQVRVWLLRAVYDRLRLRGNQFLAELRPAAALFLLFEGIDYDADEDAGLFLNAFIRWVQTTVAHYEGTLLQLTVGDKGSYLYAAFGAPIAHGDDAERALAAAFDLKALPAQLGFIRNLGIGLTHGQMYAGAYGAPTRRTYGLLGDKTNLAARLMQQAPLGDILCDDEIYRLARGRWEFEALPAIRVKGKAGLIRVYRPMGRAGSATQEGTSGLIGRKAEVARLEAALDDLEAGTGRVLFIQGEAGIGKSRLVAELVRLVRARGLSGLLGAGRSIEQQTSYRAWRDIFTSFFALEETDNVAERQARVRSVVQEVAPKMMQRLPLLNDIFPLELPDTLLTAALDPALRRESLAGLLVALLQAWAQERPLVLVLEDAHWLDNLSWELAQRVANILLAASQPLLFVVVTRPPERGSQVEQATQSLQSLLGTERLSLTELGAGEIVALVTAQLGLPPGELPRDVVALLASRAAGNPFFAEEFAFALRDQGFIAVEQIGGTARCIVSPTMTEAESILPDSLQGLILARIDRLPPERQFILKVAAVIGHTFAFSPLQATLNRFALPPSSTLETHLEGLMRRDFTLLEASEPELTYIFKHIITQEVAYQTLLFTQRKEIHRAVAEWYELQVGGPANSAFLPFIFPLLVHHYHQAGDNARERTYARRAGEQAAKQYANVEAVAFLSRALELTPEMDLAERYELLRAREEVYEVLDAHAEQLEDIEALAALAEALDDDIRRAEVWVRRAHLARAMSNYPTAIAAAQEAITLARAVGDAALEAKGLIQSGVAHWQTASYPEARVDLERALALSREHGLAKLEADSLSGLGIVADLSGDRQLAQTYFKQNLALSRQMGDRKRESNALNSLGISHWRRSNFAEAITCFETALQIYHEIGSRSSEGLVLGNLAIVSNSLRNYHQTYRYAEQALRLIRETGYRYAESRTLGVLGWAAQAQGDYMEAVRHFEQALAIDREVGDRQDEPYRLSHLGFMAIKLGDFMAARRYYDEALRLSQETGDRDATVFAERGLCLLFHHQGDHETAARHGERALRMVSEGTDAEETADVWTYLGHARSGSGRWAEAAEAYHEALVIISDASTDDPAIEPRAGLAQVALAQGDLSGAQAQVEFILPHLGSRYLDAAHEPFRVYYTCYRVLEAAADERALVILRTAYEKLQSLASRLDDEKRQSFFGNVAINRELVALWERQHSHLYSSD